MNPRNRALALAGILLAIFLSALESTVVATAMPTIVATLGGLSVFSWVFSAYLLSSTVTMPLWGRLSDLHGRKRLFLAGVSLFMAGSALCGLSGSMGQLIFFRFLQGLGAGAVLPLTFTLIGELFELEERARMQGFFSGVWGLASVVGPWIGGLLVDHASWRWIFYLNIPFGLLSLVLVSAALPGGGTGRDGKASLDWAGTLSFTASVVSLLVGLTAYGRSAPLGLALFAASAALMALYVRLEARTAHPLLPLALFRIPMFRTAQAAGLFTGMAMFGSISFIPLFMQSVLATDATGAGRVLTPFMLSWVVFSIAGSRVLLRTGYRAVVISGGVLLVAGFAMLLSLDAASSHWRVFLCMALQGAGMGLNMAPFMIAVQTAVPKQLLGAATSATQFVRTVGGAVGVAVMGAVLSHRLLAESRKLLADPSPASQALGRLLEKPDQLVASAGHGGLPQSLLEAARLHMAAGLHGVFVAGLLFAVLAFLACSMVPSGSAHSHAWKEPVPPGPE